MRKNLYSTGFYKSMGEGSRNSARVICPIVMQYIDVSSVLDLGCGTGAWLSVFAELDVKEIVGIDGSYIDKEILLIDQSHFIAGDLKKPVNLNRKFDLAVSLEVAEHLPKKCAKTIVDSLCAHSDVVLFSAAIPGQIGRHHINCQWQSYWASLFKQNGYSSIDFIRAKIWNNKKVSLHYRQNIMLYVKDNTDIISEINKKVGCPSAPMDILHPENNDPKNYGLLQLLHMQRKIMENGIPVAARALKRELLYRIRK